METKKKPYTKPQLRIIELKAEEVLSAGCKSSTSAGKNGANCLATRCGGLGS